MLDWKLFTTAPGDRDFFVHLKSGYITRARFINGKYLATDSNGSVGKKTDTTPTHWAEIPDGPT